jgi:hypothetical protein
MNERFLPLREDIHMSMSLLDILRFTLFALTYDFMAYENLVSSLAYGWRSWNKQVGWHGNRFAGYAAIYCNIDEK